MLDTTISTCDVRKSLGISVQSVAYSPDGVADYTLMLILMAVRNAKSTIGRAQVHDYRLNEVRGNGTSDLTVGVIGTGSIGTAVLDRLRGFGCDVVAYDRCPKTSVDYVSLDELLRAERRCDVPYATQRGYTPSPERATD